MRCFNVISAIYAYCDFCLLIVINHPFSTAPANVVRQSSFGICNYAVYFTH